jgi:hypothetical protein
MLGNLLVEYAGIRAECRHRPTFPNCFHLRDCTSDTGTAKINKGDESFERYTVTTVEARADSKQYGLGLPAHMQRKSKLFANFLQYSRPGTKKTVTYRVEAVPLPLCFWHSEQKLNCEKRIENLGNQHKIFLTTIFDSARMEEKRDGMIVFFFPISKNTQTGLLVVPLRC